MLSSWRHVNKNQITQTRLNPLSSIHREYLSSSSFKCNVDDVTFQQQVCLSIEICVRDDSGNMSYKCHFQVKS